MKKRIVKLSIVVLIGMLCVLLAIGPEKVQAEGSNLPTTVLEVTPAIQEYEFEQVPEKGNEINGYRKEHQKRIEANTLYRDEEVEFLKEHGFYIYNSGGYFNYSRYSDYSGTLDTNRHPIIFKSENGIEVWGVNSYGELYVKSLEGKTSNGRVDDFYGLIHYTAQEAEANDEEIVYADYYRVISYQAETGTVKHWYYGEVLGESKVPENSVYVGDNGVGYLFQSENDVWVVRSIYEDDERFKDSEVIVHNVKYVIDTNYEIADEAGYYPLFLMTDGSLKIYMSFIGQYDDPVDSESKLIEIEPEGESGDKYIVDRYTSYAKYE